MTAVRALFIQNEDDAPAGLLGEWATARGVEVQTVRPDSGEALPGPDGWDFAAALGSAASVFDGTVAWIADELSWLRRADAAGLPVLGICFGAQALAAALGGNVRRAPEPELGWMSVACNDLTPAGEMAPGPWFAWHQDLLEPPPAARVVASNAAGVQAFVLRRHLAVQFHPEVTPEIAETWAASAREDFPGAPIGAGQVRAESERVADTARQHAFALFDAFLTGARAGGRITSSATTRA